MRRSETVLKLTLVLAFTCFASGCARVSMGTLDIVSTRPVTAEQLQTSGKRLTLVQGRSSTNIFIFIPMGHPSIEDAVEKALKIGGGEFLKNANVHYRFWWLPFVFGRETIEVQGEVYR